MASAQFGRIVQVEVLDPQGRNPKVRPAVIVTPDEAIDPDGEIDVVAITTQLDQARRPTKSSSSTIRVASAEPSYDRNARQFVPGACEWVLQIYALTSAWSQAVRC